MHKGVGSPVHSKNILQHQIIRYVLFIIGAQRGRFSCALKGVGSPVHSKGSVLLCTLLAASKQEIVGMVVRVVYQVPNILFYDFIVSDCEITENNFKILFFSIILLELHPKMIKFADNKRRNHCPPVMKSSNNLINIGGPLKMEKKI